MLTILRKRKKQRRTSGRFTIVASTYNARYVDAMVRAAKAELKRAGVKNLQVIRVPGAYEIPIVAARLARTGSPSAAHPTQDSTSGSEHGTRTTEHSSSAVPLLAARRMNEPLSAIICLGVILRGETTHAAHIGEAVSRALMDIQLRYELPVIHEVLLLENEAQARVRCLGKQHNRGTEAAQTALAMAKLLDGLPVPPG